MSPSQQKVRFNYKKIGQVTLIGSKAQTRGSTSQPVASIGMASGAIEDKTVPTNIVERSSGEGGSTLVDQNRLQWYSHVFFCVF